jgi:hypothetical protein
MAVSDQEREEQLHQYQGPPLDNINGWFDDEIPDYNTWRNGGANTPDVSLPLDPDARVEWLTDYITGRYFYQDTYVAAAEHYVEVENPVAAIVMARCAFEIPFRDLDPDAEFLIEPYVAHRLPDKELDTKLVGIIEASRAAIAITSASFWRQARDSYPNRQNPHPVGISHTEQAAQYHRHNQYEDATMLYRNAGSVLRFGIAHTPVEEKSAKSLAPIDVQSLHLVCNSLGYLRALKQMRSMKILGQGHLFDFTASAYALDDFGGPSLSKSVYDAYTLLGGTKRTSDPDKLFFRHEANEVAKVLESNGDQVIASKRPDNRARRPKAA